MSNAASHLSDYELTQERLVPGQGTAWDWAIHRARYGFASQFVRGKRVFDCASGVGYGSEMLARAGAAQVVGADISWEAAQFTPARSNLSYTVQDAEAPALRSDAFDVVVSFETLEHLIAPERFIGSVERVLRPGGLFAVSVPNREAIGPYADADAKFSPFHAHEYDLAEFRSLLLPHFVEISFYYQLCPDRRLARAQQLHRAMAGTPAATLRGRLPTPLVRILRGLRDGMGALENRLGRRGYYEPRPFEGEPAPADAFVLLALCRKAGEAARG